MSEAPWLEDTWVRRQLEADRRRWVELRHDLHRHPELGFKEHRTQGKVREALERLGYTPVACAGTGLWADLRPDLVATGNTVALRADLDALPMHEHTDLPYRSVHDGVAHKCGHDGHTATLLATAALLAARRDDAPINVRLLFQPAEEGVDGGGARVMVAEGAVEGVREAYGFHSWPAFPKGQVHVQPGPMLAHVHSFVLTLVGKGGHGSQPQHCRDPIVAGAHIVTALQTVVSRGLDYRGGAVVSVCGFAAGGVADNVIPGTAVLRGTVRSFDPAVTKSVLARMRQVIEGSAQALGVEAQLSIEEGFPVTMNAAECAAAVARAADETLGPRTATAEGLPVAAAEDFAYFAQAVPGAYAFLGAGRPGEDTPGCHHPDFDFDDELIEVGARLQCAIVRDRVRTWLERTDGP